MYDLLRWDSPPDGAVLPPLDHYADVAWAPRIVTLENERGGYSVHPAQCLHRKRCYYYRAWTCADCGEKL
jgi:hypothetical protein